MRVCVLGPPAVGKTAICAELAKQYKLHHIKLKDVIEEAMAKLEASAARADKADEEEDDGRGKLVARGFVLKICGSLDEYLECLSNNKMWLIFFTNC